MSSTVKSQTSTGARVQVYDFGEKTRILFNKSIVPEVNTAIAFCNYIGMVKSNYYAICGKELEPLQGGHAKRVFVSHKVLSSITKAYNIPASFFTSDITGEQFENLLNKGLWESLLELKEKIKEFDFTTCRPDSRLPTGNTRFGPKSETAESDLGIFRQRDAIAFEFNGKPNWNVILLNRRPDGKIICLVPNDYGSKSTINEEGYLRLPEESYWEVYANDLPGTHLFACVFYDPENSDEIDSAVELVKSLTVDSPFEDLRIALSGLYENLNKYKKRQRKPYNIIVKDMYVTAG